MKVSIKDDRIMNFENDNYFAANDEVVVKEVKGFSPDIVMEEVLNNKVFDNGVYKFYLDKNGIVKQLDIKTQPEYIVFKENERKCQYINYTDSVFIKAFRELIKDDAIRAKLSSATQQEVTTAEMKVQEIKNTIK